MSVSLKNAVRIASIVSVSMKVMQIAFTLKETMVDIHTKQERRRKNTIHTMCTNVMFATYGKRKENPMEESNVKAMREEAESLGKILLFVTLSKDEYDSI